MKCLASPIPKMTTALKFKNVSRDPDLTHVFVITRLTLDMAHVYTKFEDSTFHHSMMEDPKHKKGWFGVIGVNQGHGQMAVSPFDRVLWLLIHLRRNYGSIIHHAPFLRYIKLFVSSWKILPNKHVFGSQAGVDAHWNFTKIFGYREFQQQKTRVLGYCAALFARRHV